MNENDVRRFDVAMDQTFSVQVNQSTRQSGRNCQGPVQVQTPTARQFRAQRVGPVRFRTQGGSALGGRAAVAWRYVGPDVVVVLVTQLHDVIEVALSVIASDVQNLDE